MSTTEIVAALDMEINRLTQARNLLTGMPNSLNTNGMHTVRRGGRPKGSLSIQASDSAPTATPVAKKRPALSPEGRARIAAAMKKRWAAKRGAVKAIKSVKK